MIYLDNAATSYPKPEAVYQAVDHALRHCGANPGRGGHRMALDASRLLLAARETIASFFAIPDASRVVFTSGATEALNLALFGALNSGDRVVTTSMEHNAVLRPLRALQDRGVEFVKVKADQEGFVSPTDLSEACSQPTKMVVMTHCSNVTGTVQAIADIGPWCRQQEILFVVDAAQSAGVLPIDVEAMGIDLLAVPGHKGLMGPTGTGFLYIREGLELSPLIYGGTGSHSSSPLPPEELPERFESGTLNTPGIAGLAAGVEFLHSLGSDAVLKHERELLEQLVAGLKEIPGVRLYGPSDLSCHGGALSLTLDGRDPAEVGFLLDREHDIMVRVGLHCAPDAHRTIGTFPSGTIRISPGFLTIEKDIVALLAGLKKIA